MSDYAKSLLEKRANTWNEAKALLDCAAAEKRELTAEEEVSYGKMSADLEALRSRADQLVADEASAAASETALRSLLSKPVARGAEAEQTDAEESLRALARGEIRSYDLMPTREEARALSVGTGTAGGYTVPTGFYGTLWTHLRENATLINAGAKIINTDSGNDIEVPTTTGFGAAALVAEAAAIAENDPAITQRVLKAYKYGQLVKVSSELVNDTGFDLLGFLAEQTGINVGNALGAHLVTGSGTAQPTGIVTSSTLGVTTATTVAGVPSMDNLIDLFYSVIAPYRNRATAAWVIKDTTAAAIRKIKDTTNNYIWQPSVVLGAPDLLLSKPVYTDPNIAATGTGNKSVLFGDISAYAVRVVNGVRFERSDDYAFNTDQVTFRTLIRADGLLVDQTGAVKHVIGAST